MTTALSIRAFALFRRRTPVVLAALAVALLGTVAPARAQLIITPTFDSSITSDPNAATIEATINAAIQQYQTLFTNNITVHITFQEMSSGLGQSNTFITQIPYASLRTALANNATSANAMTALASLPVQSTSPVDGNTNLWVTTANARALGFSASESTDSTIGLNTSIMNLSRSGAQNPSFYDLQAVAQHEIDEALGLGSGLNLPTNFPRLSRPEDLFRYSANGVRSYTTSAGTSYFSINGGATNLDNFNQAAASNGGDFGDWVIHSPSQVQDWAGTPGTQPNLGVEITALNVIGYELAPSAVPEPGSLLLLSASSLLFGAYGWHRRRRAGATIKGQ